MKQEILGYLAKANSSWPETLLFSGASEYPISTEFEGGVLLPYKHDVNIEFVVVKRFVGSDKPPFQVRLQKVVERHEDDTKYVVILERIDCDSDQIYKALLRMYKPYVNELFNQPTNQN